MIVGAIQKPIASAIENALGLEGGLTAPGALTIAAANPYIPTGTLLTATLAAPAANPPASYQWYRGATFGGGGAWAAIGGATSSTYTTVNADTGYSMRCVATNPVGSSTSNTLLAEIDVTAPVLSWAGTLGSSPTITPGTWTDAPTLTYDLYRDGVVTSTTGRTLAQANAYVAVNADVGLSLLWRERDVAAGLGVDTNAVQSVPLNTVAPVTSGTSSVGATLTCTTGTWLGADSYTYQWQRAGVDIGGATASTYVQVGGAAGDMGPAITCNVKGVNEAGSSASTASNALTYSVLTALSPIMWVDYSDPSNTIVSNAFSALADKSGLGSRNWAQATAGLRPGSTRTVNGRIAGDYDGTDDIMSGPTITTLATFAAHAFEVIVVFNADAIPAYVAQKYGSGLLDASPLSSMRFWFSINAGSSASLGGLNLGWFNGSADVNVSTGTGSVPVAGTTYRARGGFTGSAFFTQLGSVALNSSATATGVSGTTQAMETGKDGNGTTYFNGLVCEVIMTNAVCSASQRADVDAYVGWKWAATI